MVKGNSYDLFTAVDLVTRSIYRESAQMITLQKDEVAGSNPTRSIFINLVEYGIKISTNLNKCLTKPTGLLSGGVSNPMALLDCDIHRQFYSCLSHS